MSRRFFGALDGGAAVLTAGEAHHAAVLRVQPGDRIVVFDGRGREADVEVLAVGQDAVEGRIIEIRQGRTLPLHLTLVQGLPKAAKLDQIVRMGTEIGVAEFVPVVTERSVKRGGRLERWQRIAREAATQSGRASVPEVHGVQPLEAALAGLDGYDLVAVPWEEEEDRTIADALRDPASLRRVAIVIGPEGGLAPHEVSRITERGGVPVSLGPLTLRTETAGLVAAAMVVYAVLLTRNR